MKPRAKSAEPTKSRPPTKLNFKAAISCRKMEYIHPSALQETSVIPIFSASFSESETVFTNQRRTQMRS
jgi:hypothetical protein